MVIDIILVFSENLNFLLAYLTTLKGVELWLLFHLYSPFRIPQQHDYVFKLLIVLSCKSFLFSPLLVKWKDKNTTKAKKNTAVIFQESDFFQSIFNFYMTQNNFTYSNHSNQLTHLHVHILSLKTEYSSLFLNVQNTVFCWNRCFIWAKCHISVIFKIMFRFNQDVTNNQSGGKGTMPVFLSSTSDVTVKHPDKW